MIERQASRYFLLTQLLRFGLIGLLAAAVHFFWVVLFVEYYHWQPLVANLLAFILAFQVSYWGHRLFTFRGTQQKHSIAAPRLFLVSFLTLLANESLYYLFMAEFHLSYRWALFLVLSILPGVVFMLNKFWVFESVFE